MVIKCKCGMRTLHIRYVCIVCRSFLFFLDNLEYNDPNVGYCTFSAALLKLFIDVNV